MSDLKAKMHQNRFRLRLRPRPCWGSLQRSPAPQLDLRGSTSKGKGECREGEGRGWAKARRQGKGRRERGEGRKKEGVWGKRGGEEREREGHTCHTNSSLLAAPLLTANACLSCLIIAMYRRLISLLLTTDTNAITPLTWPLYEFMPCVWQFPLSTWQLIIWKWN